MSLVQNFLSKDIRRVPREKILPIINEMFSDTMPYHNIEYIKERTTSFFLKHKVKLQKLTKEEWGNLHHIFQKPKNELTHNDATNIFNILTFEKIDTSRRKVIAVGAASAAVVALNPTKALGDGIGNLINNYENEERKIQDQQIQASIGKIQEKVRSEETIRGKIQIKNGYYIIFSSNTNIDYAYYNQKKLYSIKEYKKNVILEHGIKIGNNVFIRTLIGPFNSKESVDWKPLSKKMTSELNTEWTDEEPFIVEYKNGILVDWLAEIKPDLQKAKVMTKKEMKKKLTKKISKNSTIEEIITKVVDEYNYVSPYKHIFTMKTDWVKSMIWIESTFRPKATSWEINKEKKRVPLGKGYMQLTDEACKQVFTEFGKSKNQGLDFFRSSNCYDPYLNVFWGVRHFAWTISQFLYDSTKENRKIQIQKNKIAEFEKYISKGSTKKIFYQEEINNCKNIIYSSNVKYSITFLNNKFNFDNVLKFGVASYNSGPKPTKKYIAKYGYDYKIVGPYLYKESRNHVIRFYASIKENGAMKTIKA